MADEARSAEGWLQGNQIWGRPGLHVGNEGRLAAGAPRWRLQSATPARKTGSHLQLQPDTGDVARRLAITQRWSTRFSIDPFSRARLRREGSDWRDPRLRGE